jgi:hypothetical protein
MNKRKESIDNLFEASPSFDFDSESNPFTEHEIEVFKVRWGDCSFGLANEDCMEDIDSWVHEFTEYIIDYVLQVQFNIHAGDTILQILGLANGLKFRYKNVDLFATISHLITSLATGSFVFTENDGFVFMTDDEFWDLIKDKNQRKNKEDVVITTESNV